MNYELELVIMDEFTYISTVKTVANEDLFKRTLMTLVVDRYNSSGNCLGDALVTSSSICTKYHRSKSHQVSPRQNQL
jgi:hypothetical protein